MLHRSPCASEPMRWGGGRRASLGGRRDIPDHKQSDKKRNRRGKKTPRSHARTSISRQEESFDEKILSGERKKADKRENAKAFI